MCGKNRPSNTVPSGMSPVPAVIALSRPPPLTSLLRPLRTLNLSQNPNPVLAQLTAHIPLVSTVLREGGELAAMQEKWHCPVGRPTPFSPLPDRSDVVCFKKATLPSVLSSKAGLKMVARYLFPPRLVFVHLAHVYVLLLGGVARALHVCDAALPFVIWACCGSCNPAPC